jgi:uncharacterized protein Smg (DUF494 family)
MHRDNFFEIVLFLAERFSGIYPQKWELDEASRFLNEMGYDNGEISRAISWFFLQAEPDGSPLPHLPPRKSAKGFRVLSPQEMNRITPEAHGYLIELLRIGVIDDGSLEEVMDHAMSGGQDIIDREDVIQIVSRVIHGISDEDMKKGR